MRRSRGLSNQLRGKFPDDTQKEGGMPYGGITPTHEASLFLGSDCDRAFSPTVGLGANEKGRAPGKKSASRHHSIDRIWRASRVVSRWQAHRVYEQKLRRRVRD